MLEHERASHGWRYGDDRSARDTFNASSEFQVSDPSFASFEPSFLKLG